MNMPQLSDDAVNQLVADTLRMFVGQGRRYSWDDLATMTGDDVRKLRSYVEPGSRMPGPVMLRVFAALPPEAWGRINRPMGYAAPSRLEFDNDATVRCAMARAARLVANGNEFLEDGVLTHGERTQLGRDAEELVPVLMTLIDGKT